MTSVRDVNLNRLVVFVAVVETGSLTAAAERLGIAKTMVSAHIQRLEKELGASLIVRTTRRLSVTDTGRAFYDASCHILHMTEAALSAASSGMSPMQGTLRVSAPVDYGALVVAPALVRLRESFPELDVDLTCADHYVDLIAEGIDVAVRLGNLPDSNYRSVGVGRFMRWLVASPAFVAKHGTPTSLRALATLPHVALSNMPHPNTLDLMREPTQTNDSGVIDAGTAGAANTAGAARATPAARAALQAVSHSGGVKQSRRAQSIRSVRCTASTVRCNTANAARAAVLSAGGFALLTSFAIADDLAAGRLVRLLPQWSGPPAAIQAVFPPTDHPSRKVRAFIEALRAQIDAQRPHSAADTAEG